MASSHPRVCISPKFSLGAEPPKVAGMPTASPIMSCVILLYQSKVTPSLFSRKRASSPKSRVEMVSQVSERGTRFGVLKVIMLLLPMSQLELLDDITDRKVTSPTFWLPMEP